HIKKNRWKLQKKEDERSHGGNVIIVYALVLYVDSPKGTEPHFGVNTLDTHKSQFFLTSNFPYFIN
ncbi:unnamed protein product, partial [Arabidopsis halleri]